MGPPPLPQNPVRVRVETVFGGFNTSIRSDDTGRNLMDRMAYALGLHEVTHFGLMAVIQVLNKGSRKTESVHRLLTHNTSVCEQVGMKSGILHVRLMVCFPPQDVDQVLQYVTKKSLFLGIKDMILLGQYYCPPEMAFLMAAYATQARHGPYNSELHHPKMLDKVKLLPQRVIAQLNMKPKEISNKVMGLYQTLHEATREEAMMTYLRMAQDLDQFCVRYCDVTNQDGFHPLVGISPVGVNIFSPQNRLAPVTVFHLGEIRSVSYRNQYINLTIGNKASEHTLTFNTGRLLSSKRLCATLLALHEIYLRALETDSAEVRSVAAEAKQEKELRMARNRPQSRNEKMAASEEHRWVRQVQQKLTEYDAQYYGIKADLDRISVASQTLDEKLAEAEEKNRDKKKQYRESLKEWDFYETEMRLNNALIPTLTRTGMSVSKKTMSHKQEFRHTQNTVDHLRMQQEGVRTHETVLQTSLANMGNRKVAYLEACNINPFDGVEEGAFELKTDKEKVYPVPWEDKEGFCDKDYNIMIELERLQSELAEKTIAKKRSVKDMAYESNREHLILNKFARLKNLLKVDLPDRVKLVQNWAS